MGDDPVTLYGRGDGEGDGCDGCERAEHGGLVTEKTGVDRKNVRRELQHSRAEDTRARGGGERERGRKGGELCEPEVASSMEIFILA
jgi:hypothetical protein